MVWRSESSNAGEEREAKEEWGIDRRRQVER